VPEAQANPNIGRQVGGSPLSPPRLDGARCWNERRLIIFPEWEDTRLWLERRLKEAFADTDLAEERIAT